MMQREWTFFVFMFLWGTILSYVAANSLGVASTTLTEAMGRADTKSYVASTSGFLDADYLIIGSERITYTGKSGSTFTGLVRGDLGTDARSYPSGTTVYTEGLGLLNQVVGMDILQTLSDDGMIIGSIKVAVGLPLALIGFVIDVATWDFSYLDGHMTWFRMLVCWPITAGFVFGLVQLIFRKGG